MIMIFPLYATEFVRRANMATVHAIPTADFDVNDVDAGPKWQATIGNANFDCCSNGREVTWLCDRP